MREWLRLFEETQIFSPDEEDPSERAEQERYDRQRRIEETVKAFCERELGWQMEDSYAVIFDTDENELSIQPDEVDYTLEQLNKLAALGEVTISGAAVQWNIVISIKTGPGFDIRR